MRHEEPPVFRRPDGCSAPDFSGFSDTNRGNPSTGGSGRERPERNATQKRPRGSRINRRPRQARPPRTLAKWTSLILLTSALSVSCSDPPAKSPTPEYALADGGDIFSAGLFPSSAQEPHVPRFTDITAASGIDFRHVNGAFGKKWMPETLGSGVCFLDANGDGLQDLFFVNSGWFSGQAPETGGDARSRLYLNRGSASFEGVDWVPPHPEDYGMGCTAADFDGDGDVDLYLTTLGKNHLYRNDGDAFVDITSESGTGGGNWEGADGVSHPEWSTAAAFADLDGDGWLDLLVANYVRWSPENDVYTTLDGVRKSYSLPSPYAGSSCRLFRNRGDGAFEEVTRRAGLYRPEGKSLGLALVDFNGDSRLDIVVTNDTRPNYLYLAKGDGTFAEVGLEAGIAYDEAGRARAGMGVDIAPMAPDGRLAIAIGNFSHEPISLYQQVQPGIFLDVAGQRRLARSTLLPLSFGVLLQDINMDGLSDAVLANGHLEPDIEKIAKEVTFRQRPQIFLATTGGRFAEIPAAAFPAGPLVARGLAAGDIDGDGDVDLVFTQNGGKPRVIRIDSVAPDRLIRVILQGKPPNRSAIGATVRLVTPQTPIARVVRTASSYMSQSELPVVLGLPSSVKPGAVTLEVRWPGKTKTERFLAVSGCIAEISQGETQVRLTPLPGIETCEAPASRASPAH